MWENIKRGKNSYVILAEAPDNKDLIYIQWYFYKRKPGLIITSPTTEQLENFYESITACDPYHESFVLVVRKKDIEDTRFIDIDIKNNVLPRLCSDLYC